MVATVPQYNDAVTDRTKLDLTHQPHSITACVFDHLISQSITMSAFPGGVENKRLRVLIKYSPYLGLKEIKILIIYSERAPTQRDTLQFNC